MDKRNEDLDDFFKEKLTSEGSTHPFDQNDWNLMEQKLDLRDKRRKQNVFLFGTLILSAAASLIIFYLWMIKSNELILLLPQDVLSMSHKYHEASVLTKDPAEKIGEEVEPSPANENFTKPAHDSKPNALKKEIKSEPRDYLAPPKNENDENIRIHTSNIVIKRNLNQNSLFIHQLPFSDSSHLNNYLEFASINLDQAVYPVEKRPMNLMLSILVAPALNSVNGFGSGEIGGDFGVLLSVDITKRLTLSTGAVYAKKLYETNLNRTIYPNMSRYAYGKVGYTGANEYNTIAFPESVNADCRVLDIPLNVNYSLVNKGKNTISIGTGLSSYIMLKENYQFEYPDQNYVTAENVGQMNENKYIMGILNFQASYTRQLNSKVGISLQPYLKVPLRHIGYAETKLKSAGMAVNVNFSLNGKD